MKKHERRSPFQLKRAVWIALGCAVFAPLGCGGDESSTGSTAGASGAGGAGGTGGSGGTAGTTGTDAEVTHCGGFATLKCPEPAEIYYCDYEDKQACGQTDATGTCILRPDVCPDDCPGVCGCDGKFYCNVCIAHRAGTDDVPSGSCSDAGNSSR